MTRILIVEDEQDIASVLQDYLRHDGHDTEHLADGRQALERLRADPPDLTLLDVMLPGLDGLGVLRGARACTQAPVIMLTARAEEIDRLIGLELGADDYICKPFSPREVVARVRAVLRRTAANAPHASTQGPLVLDETEWNASLHGLPLQLTRREFRLLQALARHPGRIFSRGQLLELAYELVDDVTERAIDSHIKNLRRKLAQHLPGLELIHSIYGLGYRFDP